MTDQATMAAPEPARKKSRFGRKLLLVVTGLLALYLLFIFLFGSVFVYSDGNRTGYIYKFSRKGFIFKTYEGILKTGFINIGNTSTPNEEWTFSVKDDDVARQIENMDQRAVVKLHYKQYFTRLFWQGDTKYFVYKVEVLPQR